MKKIISFGITLLVAINLTACRSKKVSESTSSPISSLEQSARFETSSTTAAIRYNVDEMNVKVADSFNKFVKFNQQGGDGYERTELF